MYESTGGILMPPTAPIVPGLPPFIFCASFAARTPTRQPPSCVAYVMPISFLYPPTALTGSSVIAKSIFGYCFAYFFIVSPSRKPAAITMLAPARIAAL